MPVSFVCLCHAFAFCLHRCGIGRADTLVLIVVIIIDTTAIIIWRNWVNSFSWNRLQKPCLGKARPSYFFLSRAHCWLKIRSKCEQGQQEPGQMSKMLTYNPRKTPREEANNNTMPWPIWEYLERRFVSEWRRNSGDQRIYFLNKSTSLNRSGWMNEEESISELPHTAFLLIHKFLFRKMYCYYHYYHHYSLLRSYVDWWTARLYANITYRRSCVLPIILATHPAQVLFASDEKWYIWKVKA